MIQDARQIVDDFVVAAQQAGLRIGRLGIEHRSSPAPHKPYSLPNGRCAVYVFSLSAEHGRICPAGPHRVLKVGMAGPNSNARFRSHHYNPRSSLSNLASTLLQSRLLWAFLGIEALSEADIGMWMRSTLDHDAFFVPADDSGELIQLERYVRARLGPVFEGG